MDAETKARLKRMIDSAARNKPDFVDPGHKTYGKKSKYIGVYYMKDRRTKRWRARVKSNNRLGTIYVDYFDTEEEAARAYDNALLRLRPHRRNKELKLNFPQ